MNNYFIRTVDYETVKPFILKRHYAKRMPPVSYSFGLYQENLLVGIITYGIPASPFLCKGVCGEELKDNVLELNRLVLLNNKKNEASYLVGNSLRLLPKPSIIVSYADTLFNHIGYVYQSTNWLYTGCTKARTDMFSLSGHSRHNIGDSHIRQDRSAKHRYIYFIGSKKQVKYMRLKLNYEILEYPKGNNSYYESTESIESQLIMI